jgi:hypothetical protein
MGNGNKMSIDTMELIQSDLQIIYESAVYSASIPSYNSNYLHEAQFFLRS